MSTPDDERLNLLEMSEEHILRVPYSMLQVEQAIHANA